MICDSALNSPKTTEKTTLRAQTVSAQVTEYRCPATQCQGDSLECGELDAALVLIKRYR